MKTPTLRYVTPALPVRDAEVLRSAAERVAPWWDGLRPGERLTRSGLVETALREALSRRSPVWLRRVSPAQQGIRAVYGMRVTVPLTLPDRLYDEAVRVAQEHDVPAAGLIGGAVRSSLGRLLRDLDRAAAGDPYADARVRRWVARAQADRRHVVGALDGRRRQSA